MIDFMNLTHKQLASIVLNPDIEILQETRDLARYAATIKERRKPLKDIVRPKEAKPFEKKRKRIEA